MFLFVLLEGASDMPTVREVLSRRFGLTEDTDFRLIPHRGRGRLPENPLAKPDATRRGLLDVLPAKLQGLAYLGRDACVVVLIDADQDDCRDLLVDLRRMLDVLPKRPRNVLFRLAIEETESWFIADPDAVARAYPRARLDRLRRLRPDSIVGAWEELARALAVPALAVTGATKARWAEAIAPHLDLRRPRSPSLKKFIEGVGRHVAP